MTEQSPPPPPPPPEEAVVDTPKKVWSKPCILRIVDGALETQSGAKPEFVENPTYHPS